MMSLLDRMADKVLIGDDCWEWTAAKTRDGYGILTGCPEARSTRVHRIMYELLVGPIPDGLSLDHLCRVRHCVNPKHLEPVTSGENVLRGDTRAARNAAKTHCIRGHSFADYGSLTGIGSQRQCRECGRLKQAALRDERRRMGLPTNPYRKKG